MVKQLFLPLAAVAAFIVLVGLMVQGKIGNFKPIYNPEQNSASQTDSKIVKIDKVEIEVEVAKTDEERKLGLSGRKSLENNAGMLFVLPSNSKPTFWMKDTLIPLDIIWIKDAKIVKIDENVPTQIGANSSDLKLYPAPGVVDFVLEVNAGFSEENSIDTNDIFQMQFDL